MFHFSRDTFNNAAEVYKLSGRQGFNDLVTISFQRKLTSGAYLRLAAQVFQNSDEQTRSIYRNGLFERSRKAYLNYELTSADAYDYALQFSGSARGVLNFCDKLPVHRVNLQQLAKTLDRSGTMSADDVAGFKKFARGFLVREDISMTEYARFLTSPAFLRSCESADERTALLAEAVEEVHCGFGIDTDHVPMGHAEIEHNKKIKEMMAEAKTAGRIHEVVELNKERLRPVILSNADTLQAAELICDALPDYSDAKFWLSAQAGKYTSRCLALGEIAPAKAAHYAKKFWMPDEDRERLTSRFNTSQNPAREMTRSFYNVAPEAAPMLRAA